MSKHEQWDLKLSPAKCLLHHRRGTHADLALRLVTADLNKTRRHRITLLKLSLIAFNVLCEQLGKDTLDVKGGTTREAVVKEWIRECVATGTSRLDDDALDLWLLCGKKFDMKEQEEKTAESILKNCAPGCKRYGLLGAPQAHRGIPSLLETRHGAFTIPREAWRDKEKRRKREGCCEILRRRHLAGVEAGGSGAPQGHE